MFSPRTISEKKVELSSLEKATVYYHNIFDYPLNLSDLIKWKVGLIGIKSFKNLSKVSVVKKNGFYFLQGREGLIYKRILRERVSKNRRKTVKGIARILSFIPGIKMIAVTGSLAMSNSSEESDIDLMVVTKINSLWKVRLAIYFLTFIFGFKKRVPMDNAQKDRLCFNLWLDESALSWPKKDRNIYTAHEIAQIEPVVNKGKTYEKFLFENKWILDYWPKSVKIEKTEAKIDKIDSKIKKLRSLEKIAFDIQYSYMKNKMSREVVNYNKALFHPRDIGKIVLSKLSS